MVRLACWVPALAIFALLSGAAEAATQQRPPVEAFGNLPLVGDMQLSPDGRYIAILRRLEGERVVMISEVKLAGEPRKRAFRFSEGSIEAMRWANADRLLITIEKQGRAFIGAEERNFTRVVSVSASGDRTKTLFKRRFRHESTRYAQIVSWVASRLPGDSEHVLMPFVDNDGRFHLYRVNVRTGGTRRLVRGGSKIQDWTADATGDRLLRVDVSKRREEVEYLARLPGRDWQQIVAGPLGGDLAIRPLAFGDRPELLYVGAGHNGYSAIFEYDLHRNKRGKLVFAHPRADVESIEVDERTDRLLSAFYTIDQPQVHHFDKARADLQKKLNRSFPKTPVNRIISSTDDRTAHIIATSGPNQPKRYFYFDTKANHAYEIGQAYPDLFGVKMGKVRKLTYKARDGLTLPAYLTLPPGAEAKNLPLVVLPHGGPAARDAMTFDYWAQFLANRGYAVLQPQFRGSTGFGKAFAEAGEQEWGGKMQDDVTDGVKHLIAEGIADPQRICIMGGSYGGYAALMGAVKTPDLYKCAISVAGVSDLLMMLRDERKELSIHYWERHIGDAGDDREKLIATSPARQAHKIRIPILLIHGEEDLVVPFEHSEEMAEALEEAGKPHKLVRLEGEDHFLTFGETRIAMLREAERFLAQHLGRVPAR